MVTEGAADLSTVGGRIRHARKTRGLTPRQLATLLGYRSTVTVSQWEKNRRTPDIESMTRLAAVLTVSVEWLFRGEGQTPNVKHDIHADVPRGTSPVKPPESDLPSFVQAQAAEYEALLKRGASDDQLEHVRFTVRSAILHMFARYADHDALADAFAAMLLKPDEPQAPVTRTARRKDDGSERRHYRSA